MSQNTRCFSSVNESKRSSSAKKSSLKPSYQMTGYHTGASSHSRNILLSRESTVTGHGLTRTYKTDYSLKHRDQTVGSLTGNQRILDISRSLRTEDTSIGRFSSPKQERAGYSHNSSYYSHGDPLQSYKISSCTSTFGSSTHSGTGSNTYGKTSTARLQAGSPTALSKVSWCNDSSENIVGSSPILNSVTSTYTSSKQTGVGSAFATERRDDLSYDTEIRSGSSYDTNQNLQYSTKSDTLQYLTDKKSRSFQSTKFPKPVGLSNLGNTCFFNAAIQCLIRVKPLTEFILSDNFESHINTKSKRGSGGEIAREYRKFLIEMADAVSSSICPRELRSKIVSKYRYFNNFGQHDSQELLGFILDALHEDLNAGKERSNNPDGFAAHNETNNSPISRIFYGSFFSRIRCPSCSHENEIKEPFMFLTLDIPDISDKLKTPGVYGKSETYGEKGVKLEDCLKTFSREYTLDEKNKWKCDHCDNYVCATKTMGICDLPKVLIIYLKRFQTGGYYHKMTVPVEYEENLNMFEYSKNGGNYKLIGVVLHSGSLYGGHYTSVALDTPSREWYSFNDSSARKTSDICNPSSAYFLFYMREECFDSEYVDTR